MFLIKLGLALGVIVACVVLLFRFNRQLKGESGLGLEKERARPSRGDSNELEQFIAAYRRDKASGLTSRAASPTPPTAPVSPEVATPPAVGPPSIRTARHAFLSGHAKLAFLVVKAGLPDHVVFANTRVGDLVDHIGDSALSGRKVDLLVCDKDLAIVAAIDVDRADAGEPAEQQKAQLLRGAGVRYLRFAPDAFPKPAEVRQLIYSE